MKNYLVSKELTYHWGTYINLFMKMSYALFPNDFLVLSTYPSSKYSHTLS